MGQSPGGEGFGGAAGPGWNRPGVPDRGRRPGPPVGGLSWERVKTPRLAGSPDNAPRGASWLRRNGNHYPILRASPGAPRPFHHLQRQAAWGRRRM